MEQDLSDFCFETSLAIRNAKSNDKTTSTEADLGLLQHPR